MVQCFKIATGSKKSNTRILNKLSIIFKPVAKYYLSVLVFDGYGNSRHYLGTIK